MNEQKEVYEPKKIFQIKDTVWYENDIYTIKIYKDMVVIKPKNNERKLFIFTTGNVAFEENADTKQQYVSIGKKKLNLLE